MDVTGLLPEFHESGCQHDLATLRPGEDFDRTERALPIAVVAVIQNPYVRQGIVNRLETMDYRRHSGHPLPERLQGNTQLPGQSHPQYE